MTIRVNTRRQDSVNPEALKKAFIDLGWQEGGQGGLANKSYLFIWQEATEPIYPEGYSYDIIEKQ